MTDADHDLTPLYAPTDTRPADRILVQGLEFDTIVGILPAERETTQPLRVDVVLEVDSFHEAVAHEHIDRTVDYAAVARRITEIAREGQFQLVETLAETTCARLLAEFPVRRVTLRAIKPHALADAAGVGVEITRQAGGAERA